MMKLVQVGVITTKVSEWLTRLGLEQFAPASTLAVRWNIDGDCDMH